MPNAILSLTDTTGAIGFAKILQNEFGFGLYASGGTYKHFQGVGLKVTFIPEYTQFPEILNGRVKTLHPKIHGGIMARPGNPDDDAEIVKHGLVPFDLGVVNFYNLEEELKVPNLSFAAYKEKIDIGGPSMIRSCVKNMEYCAPVPEPSFYDQVIADLRANGSVGSALRKKMMARSLFLTAQFDLIALSHLANVDVAEIDAISPNRKAA